MLNSAIQHAQTINQEKKAIGYFLAAIDTDKNYVPSYSSLAATLVKKGMRQEALGYFKSAIALNGAVAHTHLQLVKDCFELSQYDAARNAEAEDNIKLLD